MNIADISKSKKIDEKAAMRLPPPIPFESQKNQTITLMPFKASVNDYSKIQTLLTVGKRMVCVAIFGPCADGVITFSNQYMGKRVFNHPDMTSLVGCPNAEDMDPISEDKTTMSKIRDLFSLQLFYDDQKHVVYVVGIYKPFNLLEVTNQLTKSRNEIHELLMMYQSEKSRISTCDMAELKHIGDTKQRLLPIIADVFKGDYHNSILAPMKSVPILTYVIPNPISLENQPNETDTKSSKKHKSLLKTFRRSMENKIHVILKSLQYDDICGKVLISNNRVKDITERGGGGEKEKRLFNIDGNNAVFIIPREMATNEGDLLYQIGNFFCSLENSIDNMEQSFQQMEEDDYVKTLPESFEKKYLETTSSRLIEGKYTGRHDPLSLSQWLKSVITLEYCYFSSTIPSILKELSYPIESSTLSKCESIFKELHTSMDTETEFSELQCSRFLPLAIKQYETDLPPRYDSRIHHNRLRHVLDEFHRVVGPFGPSCQKYANQLTSGCEAIWSKGRRLCDAISLTRMPCQQLIHRLPDEDTTDENECYEVCLHSSHIVRSGSCNCGMSIENRLDPFSLNDANCSGFISPCCANYLPVFDVQDEKTKSFSFLRLGEFQDYDIKNGLKHDGFIKSYQYLSSWKLYIPIVKSEEEEIRDIQKATESLFITSKQIGKKSKKFSLVNHNKNTEEVIIYAGLEYECSKGHRYLKRMYTNKKKDNDLTMEDNVKEWPYVDQPIFALCPTCPSSKEVSREKVEQRSREPISQLLRIFLALPKESHDVFFHAQVQVVESKEMINSVFSYESKEVALPVNTFLCFRLPLIYQYDSMTILPDDLRNLSDMVLRRGVLKLKIPKKTIYR